MKFSNEWVGAYFDHGVDVANRRVFVDELNEANVRTAVKGLYLIETESKTSPCELFVSSYGGDIYECLALYDIINTIQCPVHTFSFGKCQSAAVLIMAAGEPGHRWISPHVSFMHHAWSADLSGKEPELKASLDHYQELDKIWLRLLEKHSNKDYRFWKRKASLASDFHFSAEEAIEYGLADSIWSEKDS